MALGTRPFPVPAREQNNGTSEYQVDPLPWISALTTMVEFPENIVRRASEKWQTKLSTIPQKLEYCEFPVTLSYTRQRYTIPGKIGHL